MDMNKKTKIVLGLVIVIMILVGLFIFKSKSSADEINLGVITPLTGTFAVNGEQARNSALLAVDKINTEGGILGKKLNVQVEDGKCDASATLSAWKKLIDINKVGIVFGGHCSTETLTIAPLASTTHTIVLANITSAASIPNEGEWVFRNSSPSQYIAVKAADYVVNTLSYKKIGVITEKKDFPQTYSQYFTDTVKKDGGFIVYNEEFAPGTTDFISIISKIKNNNVDAILVSTQGGSTAGIFAKQIHDLGIEKTQIYNAGFDLASFKLGSAGYTPTKFVVVTGYADPNSQSVKDFVAAYTQKYGKQITFNLYYISAVYDMVMRVKSAMVACNSTSNNECIRNQFKNTTSYQGVSGVIPVGSTYSPGSSVIPLGYLVVDDQGNPIVKSLSDK
jgi:branched-chain amino acid transport system substrate-binding protein